ncbi:PadR family transcriptional regulator [Propionispora hippei]|uniref:PadR family transcriptional regulator, regulatory protein PadR n=1 Tax=Propionispora hippei DSM 15287 TaxID=1123003 RepID=A0A1M6PBG8_9FIRM|nr:PadR family transcriptional regulator [Propionispora hippei]SHK05212.1 PadR family transcriptional regulator, regulatory protein PadR [Propionispora hippei DSM 15287]
MDEINRQLKKGVTEILVLHLLSKMDMYGYQLIQDLDQKSSSTFKMKEGSLYPILYRLEDNRLVRSYYKEPQGREMPKKYYEITPEGVRELNKMKAEWVRMQRIVNSVLDIDKEGL